MSWLVLHLRPRTEKKMAFYCGTACIEHYLPLRRETKIYQRRRVTVHKPLFPGYCFVDCAPAQRPALLNAPYLARILTPENEAGLIHELAQIRKALEVDPELDTCSPVQRGRRVRITGGPFMGIEGVVAQLRGNTKVRLNVDMIGQAVALEVPREYLAVVE